MWFGVALCYVGGLFSELFILLQISEESKANRFYLIPPSPSPSVFLSFSSLFGSLNSPSSANSLEPPTERTQTSARTFPLSVAPSFLSQKRRTNMHTHICFRRQHHHQRGVRSCIRLHFTFLAPFFPSHPLPPSPPPTADLPLFPLFFLCLYG